MSKEKKFDNRYKDQQERESGKKFKRSIEKRNKTFNNDSRPNREYMQKDPYRDSDEKGKK